MAAADTLERPDTEADGLDEATLAAETGQSRASWFLHFFGMPIFIVLVLVGLTLYVQNQELGARAAATLSLDNLLDKTARHVQLTAISTVLVIALAVPLGILVTRPGARRVAPFVIGIGNIGQAIPSLGLLAVMALVFFNFRSLPSTGLPVSVVALVAYSFLPILRNTIVGLEQVDRSVLEAGRGMGMSNRRVLRRIELPLAVPVILAGVRTALVLNVGTATLVFLFGGGGLGEIIFSGFQLNRTPVLLTGAIVTAVLALLIDYLGMLAEEFLTPSGLD